MKRKFRCAKAASGVGLSGVKNYVASLSGREGIHGALHCELLVEDSEERR
jgi:hypothetical protein